MCCPQTKLNVTSKVKGFENITYKTVSVIRIPELLTNIISCHGFVNNTELSVILSCRIRLVDYYFQKCFVLHEKNLMPVRIRLYVRNKNQRKTLI